MSVRSAMRFIYASACCLPDSAVTMQTDDMGDI
jgi:hypothetical protein